MITRASGNMFIFGSYAGLRYLFLLPLLLTVILASVHFGYTPDDTYIYGQYAKNLLRDHQVAFNRGEASYGITGPLWLLMTALGGMVGPIVTTAKAIDLVLALSAITMFSLLALRILQKDVTAFFASMVFATHVWFLRWTGSGMETSAAVCIALAVLLAWAYDRVRLALFLAGLLGLLRPEGSLLGIVLMGDILRASKKNGTPFRTIMTPFAFYCMPLFLWGCYAFISFGSLVPNTALAKAGRQFTISEMFDTAMDLSRTLAPSDGIILTIAIGCGLIFLSTRQSWDRRYHAAAAPSPSAIRFSVITLVFSLLAAGYYVLSGTNIVSRYTLVFTPPLIIVTFLAMNNILDRSRFSAYRRHLTAACALLVIGTNLLFYAFWVIPHLQDFERGMEGALKPIGVWLGRNTEPGTKVVVSDVGAIGYFSDRYICDMGGLISTDALALTKGGIDSYEAIRDRAFKSFCDADYIVHRSTRAGVLGIQGDVEVIMVRPFAGLTMTDPTEYFYTLYRIIR